MNESIKKSNSDPRIEQIIDANLDRAREGLRVLEDWARFALGRKDLVKKLKNFRQKLGESHLKEYKSSRNFLEDECTGLSHPQQFKRNKIEDIISANSARIQESCRVIEEFARNQNNALARNASTIRYETYKLEIELLEANLNREMTKILLENDLYFITSQCPDLQEKIKSALEGGVKIIQHRFKKGTDLEHLEEATKISNLCKEYQALFIVNDRIDIALSCNADGVHLGQDDIDLKAARKILGYSKIIGISANNKSDICKAINDGSDYIGIGPVFETSIKKNKSPLGYERIKKLTKNISIPWFAIGGITSENISLLTKNGIKKVAIISDILYSDNPKEKAIMIIKTLSDEN